MQFLLFSFCSFLSFSTSGFLKAMVPSLQRTKGESSVPYLRCDGDLFGLVFRCLFGEPALLPSSCSAEKSSLLSSRYSSEIKLMLSCKLNDACIEEVVAVELPLSLAVRERNSEEPTESGDGGDNAPDRSENDVGGVTSSISSAASRVGFLTFFFLFFVLVVSSPPDFASLAFFLVKWVLEQIIPSFVSFLLILKPNHVSFFQQ
mmetsp:Transcript_18434/g.42333  ORF Transcript_18434/g.42333 Transcript_18434/m.42333 type:complete len:204 (-) Transcript_18434:642-1253(-)